MKKWGWIFIPSILICASIHADRTKEACRQEIQNIDAQVQKLETQKQKHVDLAKKYQADGDRWQYNTGRIDDAHASWAKADGERAQVIEYQRQIDHLLDQKQRIYQYYPDLRND